MIYLSKGSKKAFSWERKLKCPLKGPFFIFFILKSYFSHLQEGGVIFSIFGARFMIWGRVSFLNDRRGSPHLWIPLLYCLNTSRMPLGYHLDLTLILLGYRLETALICISFTWLRYRLDTAHGCCEWFSWRKLKCLSRGPFFLNFIFRICKWEEANFQYLWEGFWFEGGGGSSTW